MWQMKKTSLYIYSNLKGNIRDLIHQLYRRTNLQSIITTDRKTWDVMYVLRLQSGSYLRDISWSPRL